MAMAKLNIRGLSAVEKVDQARQLVSSLTGNDSITTLHPILAQVMAGADDLEAAYADAHLARQTAQTKTITQYDKEDALERLLRQLMAYIENAGGDDESTIRRPGINIRNRAPASPRSLRPKATTRARLI